MHQLADNIIELIFSVATVNPPWKLEEWAQSVTNNFKTSAVAKHMVFSYLEIVDSLLPSGNTTDWVMARQHLLEEHAPSADLFYYWDQVTRWQLVISTKSAHILR